MTITEIAKMAGVSNAAVSRYLNGGSLSQEKRERIRTVVNATGYQPDSYAQMLRTKKNRQIGVVVPKINSNSVAAITAGISRVLNRENYMFLLANTDNDEKKELDYLSLFGANRVAGIILLATILTPEHEELIQSLQVPVVLVGQQHGSFPCVYHNDYDAARELFELVLRRGRRHIGYIGVTERDVAVGKTRRRALVDVCRAYGITEEEIHFEYGSFTRVSGYEAALRLLDAVPELDALLCATDTMAIGAMQALKERGKQLPGEVSVTGIGDNWADVVVEPTLSTARYFYEESGAEAAELVLSLLGTERRSATVQQTMLGYELKIRGSI